MVYFLKRYSKVIGYSIEDLKGIIPSICMHKILLEENYKPSREHHGRLKPNMRKVVKKEVLKLLDARVIYPILYTKWVSPIQLVPKKRGITMIINDKDESTATRIVTCGGFVYITES